MGQLASIELLLRLGADSGLKNDFGQTALEVAELGEHHEIAARLSRCNMNEPGV